MAAAANGDKGIAAERTAMLEHLYRAFNERDLDAALEHLAPGVDWPNTIAGHRLHGRDEVRAYWQKQWQEIDPRVEPVRIEIAADGTARVLVDQLVRALDGEVLQNRRIEQVFAFDGPFISRMTAFGLEQDDRRDDDDEDGEDGGEAAEGGEGGESGE
jgi:limonene-1,2-epoxide hydrolase